MGKGCTCFVSSFHLVHLELAVQVTLESTRVSSQSLMWILKISV